MAQRMVGSVGEFRSGRSFQLLPGRITAGLVTALKAARRASWLPAQDNTFPKVNHVGSGFVLGEDGKRFRTRASKVVRLVDLLDEEPRVAAKQHLLNEGNTAVYLLYAHACIYSIIRKSDKDVEILKKTGALVLERQDERVLGLHLLQFAEGGIQG